MKIDPFSRRVVHKWLRSRTFQVKMMANDGPRYSFQHNISKGLPQGGVLSPVMWLAFFNPVLGKLQKKNSMLHLEGIKYKNVIFADDVTLMIPGKTKEDIRFAAEKSIEFSKQILKDVPIFE